MKRWTVNIHGNYLVFTFDETCDSVSVKTRPKFQSDVNIAGYNKTGSRGKLLVVSLH